jgi:class 3 adenylate cyclase
MASESNLPLQIEIAHVLYMDFVGYTLLPMTEQTRLVAVLQDMVRGNAEFRRAEASGELISLPTGDGMALVFFRDPAAPVNCALEIARALKHLPNMKLRMGIHTGPIYRLADINEKSNVTGAGINIAQRVMEYCDAGHILLSSTLAELLREVGDQDWATSLHDLGVCEGKRGEKLHLFNLYTEELGNSSLPTKMRPDSRNPSPGLEPRAGRTSGSRVALLYKRGAQPDEALLALLETELRRAGHSVFVDRHLVVGVEWAREIEREIRTADAVVPLLSPASMHSEMLAYEVEIAHISAQQQSGTPQLLPVRVNYTGPLPPESSLPSILDPLEYSLWQGPQDNDRLVGELLNALRQPASPALVPRSLEPVGGAVPLDSEFYIVRPTDHEFCAAIARRDSIVLVKGARQMGKTSLLARGLQQAREAGARDVMTDFQKLNAEHLKSAELLFLALADAIADKLELDVVPEDTWNPRRGPSVNFERFLRREVLGKINAPIVWGLDEVDRLFECSFGSEVFGLFRAWHNERALDPAGPWARLTLAIAYATEAHLFITDVNQSPFNVGTRMELQDFTFDQVSELNRRYGGPLRDDAEVARYYRLVSGHPYLVRRGLHEMTAHGLDLESFEMQADRDEGIFGDHLRRMLVVLVRNAELHDVVRGVLMRRPCATPESFYHLRTAGLVIGSSQYDARLRCRLYETYLARHLLEG